MAMNLEMDGAWVASKTAPEGERWDTSKVSVSCGRFVFCSFMPAFLFVFVFGCSGLSLSPLWAEKVVEGVGVTVLGGEFHFLTVEMGR